MTPVRFRGLLPRRTRELPAPPRAGETLAEARGLRVGLGGREVLGGVTRRTRRRGAGPGRAQRDGEVHPVGGPGRRTRARGRRGTDLRPVHRKAGRRPNSPCAGPCCRRRPRSPSPSRSPTSSGWGGRPGRGPARRTRTRPPCRRRWPPPRSRSSRTGRSPRCPAASGPAWSWPGRTPSAPRCCCSTSRRRRSSCAIRKWCCASEELLSRVYRQAVEVLPHPGTGVPLVVPRRTARGTGAPAARIADASGT